jgi:hypothetical protein
VRAFSGAIALGWSTVGLYLLLALWFGYGRLTHGSPGFVFTHLNRSGVRIY